uniref:Uncharacterized protein n=1 Tax=Leucogyrophana mollusca TaxID=85980 RepID=A0ACB8B7S6_9AGAM|nr:hypothetical protein BV22DRAFT_1197887 [Leucogyrophana mollusca]
MQTSAVVNSHNPFRHPYVPPSSPTGEKAPPLSQDCPQEEQHIPDNTFSADEDRLIIPSPELSLSAGTPTTSPGGELTSPEDDGEHTISLATFFGSSGTPPSWSRPPPAELTYANFPPICLVSNGHKLSKGFPEEPPPYNFFPHPFATHDVTEDDWKRFLADVKKAGSLSMQQRIKSHIIPLATGIGMLGKRGMFIAKKIQKRMVHKNRTAAGDIVDHWNHNFFNARRVEVVLAQADERLSGREGPAPKATADLVHRANELRRRSSSSYSSSLSSSSEVDEGQGNKRMSIGERREKWKHDRAERKQGRKDRRAGKKEDRNTRKNGIQAPYQLFVHPL